jgi:hypothetical protein
VPASRRSRLSTRSGLEAGRVGGDVFDGVLNVAVSEVILNEPRIRALVRRAKAAGVAQHVSTFTERQLNR